jgi:hypothetical protein
MCSKIAKLMRWHANERTDDGVFRHPADSLAWKDFDKRHLSFSGDIHNIRLGLASDGFNPFRSINIVHNTWPIIVVPYNLSPMMLMKQPFIFLSVLINGPKDPSDACTKECLWQCSLDNTWSCWKNKRQCKFSGVILKIWELERING